MTDPLIAKYYLNCYIEGQDTLDPWGVTIRWKKGEHAGMSYVTEENKLIKDVTEWKEHFVKQNDVFPEEAWEAAKKQVAGMDRENHFVTGIMFLQVTVFLKKILQKYYEGLQKSIRQMKNVL